MTREDKMCSYCKELLPLSRFGVDRQKKSGLSSRCLSCRRTLKKTEYADNPEKFLSRNRESYNRTSNKARERNKRYYRENKDKIIRRTYNNEVLRGFARRKINYAVKTGKLIKPSTCSHCNIKTNLDGHHPDYSKPLEVIWLCRGCHGKEHRKYANA